MENRSALEMPALAQALSLAAVCLPQDGCAYDRITLDIVLATAANLLRHNRPENEVRLAILWQLSASAAEQLVPEHLRPDFKALAVFLIGHLTFSLPTSLSNPTTSNAWRTKYLRRYPTMLESSPQPTSKRLSIAHPNASSTQPIDPSLIELFSLLDCSRLPKRLPQARRTCRASGCTSR